jgi:hypothetical protein
MRGLGSLRPMFTSFFRGPLCDRCSHRFSGVRPLRDRCSHHSGTVARRVRRPCVLETRRCRSCCASEHPAGPPWSSSHLFGRLGVRVIVIFGPRVDFSADRAFSRRNASMKPWNRKSPRPFRGQSPKLDRFGPPDHGAEESSDLTASGTPASADDISPLPIDFARLREAERRLDADLVEIEALIWSRLQETLRTEHRGGQPRDPRHAHQGANPGLRGQARDGNRPRRG